ncbi:hypothetical protein PsorP6_004459 [Peronosclerospora sorghi]|uniref:Uncharacterized protein n=1 Tax=Peronosclerospora sorghi TaxID=230839 RepID=A0ACC0VJI0_9STRA|nr:hypothetical protein PsorP6_004459 [Peronosclerospora sorghi]
MNITNNKSKDKVAMQFNKRPGGSQAARTKKQQKRKAQMVVEIVRPWTTPQFEELSKEERDIVLDRLQKEVADVPSTRNYAVRGINQVARAVVKGELRVVVFANNPETLVFGHLPLLCRLHHVPICVLHLSSKTFGKIFMLKSMTAIGIKVPCSGDGEDSSSSVGQKSSNDATATAAFSAATSTTPIPMQLTRLEYKKLVSIVEFLISKASKCVV